MNGSADAIQAARLLSLKKPIYDTLHTKNENQEGAMQFWEKLPPWAVMGLIGLSGLGFVIVPRIYQWSWEFGVFPEIGVALIIASILEFTIHRWMSRDLAKDVFWAAIGRILHPELRSEISWICGFQFLATRSVATVNIEEEEQDLLKVTISLDRDIENIGADNQPLTNLVAVDEWGAPNHPAEIITCEIRKGNDQIVRFDQINRDDPAAISAKTVEISLRPGEKAHIVSQAVEYKRKNDLLHMTFLYPTVNPRIEVHIPAGLDCRYGFAHRGEMEKEKFTPRKTLRGTLLPGMQMGVRWWPKRPSTSD